jgi:hypothetical protein
MQETQAKTPGVVDIGQADQQVGDQFVLRVALRAVLEAGLADALSPACQRDAGPLPRHRLLGRLAAES